MAYPVTLNVYDLSGGMAAQFSRQLVGRQIDGVWHTGIVVYGKEFYYGGGISYDYPGRTPFGQPTKNIELGITEVPEDMFMELLKDISPRFGMNNYHVFTNNCNNFTDEVATLLLGEGIPKDIVNLPQEFLATPLGRQLGPMLQQAQESLKLNSNQLFTEDGQQQPLQVRQPGGGPGQAQQQPQMDPMSALQSMMGGAAGASNPGDASNAGNGTAPDLRSMMQNPQVQQMMQQNPQMQQMMQNPQVQQMMQDPQRMQQMMQNPQMQQMMQQFQNMGGMGGMGSQPQQPISFPNPVQGEVTVIQSLGHLQKIIKDYPGVVVDFWSPRCGPCMRFKPTFESAARGNQNKKIVFCAVETDRCRDAAQAFQVRSIPQFNFFLFGKEHTKFVGADEPKFRAALGDLHKATASKSNDHMSFTFKQFKPMNRLPVGFTAQTNINKMKEFIIKFVNSNGKEVKSVAKLQAWLTGSFDIKKIDKEAIDELVALAEIAEDKSKIALIDLFRLLVLEESQAQYIVSKHWELVQVCIIGYLSAQDLKDKGAKVIQNYHLACLKFLANIYQSEPGKDAMQDAEKGKELIEFCTKSFLSCNHKVIYHAAMVLFNHLLCYRNDNKKGIQQELEVAFKTIDEVLGDSLLTDSETLVAILLCECRLLYTNTPLCMWLEETFRLFFTETHNELKKRVDSDAVKQAIDDVMSMVDLEEKKA